VAAGSSPKLDLECRACGYGVVNRAAPDRCPMCQRTGAWVHRAWRPFAGVVGKERAQPVR